jgi:hypothetical protein
MLRSLMTQWTVSRRELFRRSALLTLPALFRAEPATAGTVDGNTLQIASSYTERHGDSLSFRFTGTSRATRYRARWTWVNT